MFCIEQVFKKIGRNKITYLIISLELIVLIGFMFYTINLTFSLDNKSDTLQKEISQIKYMVINADSVIEKTDYYFKKDQIDYLNNMFDNTMQASQVIYFRYYTDYINNPDEVLYLIISDCIFINKYLQFSNQDNESPIYYIGENAIKLIEKGTKIYYDKLSIDENGIFINNIKYPLEMEHIDHDMNKTFSLDGNSLGAFYDIDIANCIIISSEILSDDYYNAYERLFLFFNDIDIAEQINISKDAISYLNNNYTTYDYSNKISKLQYEYTIVYEEITIATFLIILCLIIIIFGIGGVQIININKRKKEIGISIAIGVKRKTIAIELLVENFILITSSLIIGFVIGNLYTINTTHYLTNIYIYSTTYLIIIVCIFFSGFISFLISYLEFRNIQPINILK